MPKTTLKDAHLYVGICFVLLILRMFRPLPDIPVMLAGEHIATLAQKLTISSAIPPLYYAGLVATSFQLVILLNTVSWS